MVRNLVKTELQTKLSVRHNQSKCLESLVYFNLGKKIWWQESLSNLFTQTEISHSIFKEQKHTKDK